MEKAGKYIEVNKRNDKVKIRAGDIIYAEVYNHRVIAHTCDDSISFYGQLNDLEARLDDSFYRVGRSYLVNISCIERIDGLEIFFINGDKVRIPRRRYSDFVDAYLEFKSKI